MEGRVHKQLKQVALRWVQSTGCVAFCCEMRWDWIGIVDVAGIKTSGDIYIIEAKASNADMRSDVRSQRFRIPKIERIEASSKVDFIYYIVADGVDTSELPPFIGLRDINGRVRRNARRRNRPPSNTEDKLEMFSKFARACSWRAYGNVIRGEQEQMEFSLTNEGR